jgi:hypothetical protein
MKGDYNLLVPHLPRDIGRGLAMVTAYKNVHIRDWIALVLAEAIDRELATLPQWRWSVSRKETDKHNF